MKHENTWTNEYGDRIMLVNTGNMQTTYVASNKEYKKHCHFNSEKAAKIWLKTL